MSQPNNYQPWSYVLHKMPPHIVAVQGGPFGVDLTVIHEYKVPMARGPSNDHMEKQFQIIYDFLMDDVEVDENSFPRERLLMMENELLNELQMTNNSTLPETSADGNKSKLPQVSADGNNSKLPPTSAHGSMDDSGEALNFVSFGN